MVDILNTVDGFIGGSSWFVILLLGTGIFFTIYLKFPQIFYFKHAIRIVWGKYDRNTDEGDTTHFQALATALSGTVGTGNIAGVALAIHLGGPAALFWMVVTAVFGMTTKFVEVSLSHKYREKRPDGHISGGPMYFMKKGLGMPWLAAIFSVATIISSFGTGSLPQINSISNVVFSVFGLPHMVTGGVLAIILGLVILGGIKRIAQVTSKLVPTMAVFYIIGSLVVIFTNLPNLFGELARLVTTLWSGTAATGGFLGASLSFALNRGVNRGLFSNEAGQGSAPIAHAAAKAHEPISEGLVSMLEPFVDTIIICLLTGLAIISSGVWSQKHQNQFQTTDMLLVKGIYNEVRNADQLAEMIKKPKNYAYTGSIRVTDGIPESGYTLLHARSVAENITVTLNQKPFTGDISFSSGKPTNNQVAFAGESLVHSADLTTRAFEASIMGRFGRYIVAIGLVLFAFSTTISWSYYGEQAIIYLFGPNGILAFRLVYVLGFFIASFVDTTLIWAFSGIAIALMTLPNLFGLWLLRREVKDGLKDYVELHKQEYPNEKKLPKPW